ncbi:Crp/Fnr family transcriptional regulator [Pedobacter sp. P351]|uniref:Crp/Fnr family transcriptional regulator n=1 Tax=Pedobacter superstes TaxID=3133441 RepID=UPI0030A711E2
MYYIAFAIKVFSKVSMINRKSKNLCDVNSCFLCKGCLPEWLAAIELHKKNFEVKKGNRVFSEGDAVEGIYFVYQGTIKIHERWDSDKDLIVRFVRPGGIFGIFGLGEDQKYSSSATALEHSIVCYVGLNFFESTLKVNPELTRNLMHFFANELQCSHKSMRDLAHMPVKARIAQSFLMLRKQFGTDENGILNVELSRQDLASFSGSSYETLFKVATDFSKNKIIELTGRSMRILDELKLIEIVKQSNLQ